MGLTNRRSMRRLPAAGFAAAMLAACLLAVSAARADGMRVELDKAAVIKLKRDANVVVIANPNIADITVESPRLLFVLGLQPGETNLMVLDGDSETILSTTIVVVPPVDRVVTVNRGVLPESTYSCDPRCALVRSPGADIAQAAAAMAATASSIGQADGGGGGGAAAAGGQQLLLPTTQGAGTSVE